MTATEASPSRQPLPTEALPASVQKLLSGPAPMKQMAARGMAPLRPAELVIAIFQLSFDADDAVRAAAEAAPEALPDKIVAPPLGEPLPAAVLDFFASRLGPTRVTPLEKILYNPATGDQTFIALAARLDERELEVIAQNEARVLRCPAILEALFANRAARMSSVNRLVELCVRNGVRPAGALGDCFDDLARSISGDPDATAGAADDVFGAALAAAEGQPVPDDGDETDDVAGAAKPAAKPERASSGRQIDFSRLKMHEKIRLATLGNENCRQNLVRDPNRVVAMAAIRSPRITDAEITRVSSSRQVCEDVIRYIGNQKDLTKAYGVRLALVGNPKCPLALSLKFLNTLNGDDLKTLSRSKNVPSALSTAARRLVATRSTRQGG